MIVTTKVLLERAKAGRYAVPALNVDNLESVLGVLAACRETGRSVIIQTIPKTLAYGGVKTARTSPCISTTAAGKRYAKSASRRAILP